MKKKLLVDKEKFDAVLSQILRTKPLKRSKIKSGKKHGPRTPILSKP